MKEPTGVNRQLAGPGLRAVRERAQPPGDKKPPGAAEAGLIPELISSLGFISTVFWAPCLCQGPGTTPPPHTFLCQLHFPPIPSAFLCCSPAPCLPLSSLGSFCQSCSARGPVEGGASSIPCTVTSTPRSESSQPSFTQRRHKRPGLKSPPLSSPGAELERHTLTQRAWGVCVGGTWKALSPNPHCTKDKTEA